MSSVVMVKVPLPPADDMLTVWDERAKLQGLAASWRTETVFPATVTVPERALDV
jgi:hypothetical protein